MGGRAPNSCQRGSWYQDDVEQDPRWLDVHELEVDLRKNTKNTRGKHKNNTLMDKIHTKYSSNHKQYKRCIKIQEQQGK